MTNPTLTAPIDATTAQYILDKLGYSLQDLSEEFGNVSVGDDDISHQLHYLSIDSTFNLMGYVWMENDLYYVRSSECSGNYRTPQQAALQLIDPKLIEQCLQSN